MNMEVPNSMSLDLGIDPTSSMISTWRQRLKPVVPESQLRTAKLTSTFLSNNSFLISKAVGLLLPTEHQDEVSLTILEEAFQEAFTTIELISFGNILNEALEGAGLLQDGVSVGGACGASWEANDISYKCRTCEYDPTCAICVPCFHNGNHEGHDFSIIRTGGGCCDCGDPTAWKTSGFCRTHKGPGTSPALPLELRACTEPVLHALFGIWDKFLSQKSRSNYTRVFSQCLLMYLFELSNSCEPVLNLVVEVFLESGKTILKRVMSTEEVLKEDQECFNDLMYKLFGNPKFKEHFAELFASQYEMLLGVDVESIAPVTSSRHGMHLLDMFSVQILTVPNLALHLMENCKFLDKLLGVLNVVRSNLFTDRKLIPNNDKSLMLSKVQDRIFQDIKHLTYHEKCAHYFSVRRSDLFMTWLETLSFYQYICPFKRKVEPESPDNDNVELNLSFYVEKAIHKINLQLARSVNSEPNAVSDTEDDGLNESKPGCYPGAIADCCNALWAWSCLEALKGKGLLFPQSKDWIKNPQEMLKAMSEFVPQRSTGAAVETSDASPHLLMSSGDVSLRTLSLNIPLHRMLSLHLRESIRHLLLNRAAFEIWDLFPRVYESHSFSLTALEYPLRVPALFAQVQAGMWRRNGENLNRFSQFMSFGKGSECTLRVDRFFTQICAVLIPPDTFVDQVLQMFGLNSFFGFGVTPTRTTALKSVAHSAMRFLLNVLLHREALLPQDKELACRKDAIQCLAHSSSTFSEISAALGKEARGHDKLHSILHQIGTYVSPSVLEQGKFVLKAECWKEVDLYHSECPSSLLFQIEENFRRTTKTSAISNLVPKWASPIEPLKDLRLIAVCDRVYQMAASVLFHETKSKESNFDGLLQCSLHMLALALDCVGDEGSGNRDSAVLDPEMAPLITSAANVMGKVEGKRINDSLISLLVKLWKKCGGDSSMAPDSRSFASAKSADAVRIGICQLTAKILLKFASIDGACRAELEVLTPSLFGGEAATLLDAESASEKRKTMAKARQAAILAKMRLEQQSFAKKNNVEEIREEEDSEELLPCHFCGETLSHGMCYFVFLQRSSIVHLAGQAVPPQFREMPSLLSDNPSEWKYESDNGEREGVSGEGPSKDIAGGAALLDDLTLADSSAQRMEGSSLFENEELFHEAFSWAVRDDGEKALSSLGTALLLSPGSGLHMKACGHSAHKACFLRFARSTSVRRSEFPHYVNVAQGEFLCPVCRRLCNAVMPAIPEARSLPILSNNGMDAEPQTASQFVLDSLSAVSEEPRDLQGWQSLGTLSVEPGAKQEGSLDVLLNQLAKISYPGRKAASSRHPSLCRRRHKGLYLWETLWYSVASAELAENGSSLDMIKAAGTRSPGFVSWDNRLCSLSDLLKSKTGAVLSTLADVAWSLRSLTASSDLLRGIGFQLARGPLVAGLSTRGVGGTEEESMFWNSLVDPVLSSDPFCLFSRCLFCLPAHSMSADKFRQLVHLGYLVCVTQAILRTASACHLASFGSCSKLIGALLALLPTSHASKTAPSASIPTFSAFSGVVRQQTLHYLRRCALLQQLLFRNVPPLSDPDSVKLPCLEQAGSLEFSHWTLDTSVRKHFEASAVAEAGLWEGFFGIPALQDVLEAGEFQQQAKLWVQHLALKQDSRNSVEIYRNGIGAPFELVRLPHKFHDLFVSFSKKACSICSQGSLVLGICLFCGDACCVDIRSSVMRVSPTCLGYEIHSMQCGSGTGVFLLVKSSVTLLLRNDRVTVWNSVYLDAYGEEDSGLVRGKPLFLCKDRYAALALMVGSHGLDHNTTVLSSTGVNFAMQDWA